MQETIGLDGLDLTMRRKRARIRAWHRGTKEMDLILGGFFDRDGGGLSGDELSTFELLMTRNDQDLYRYITRASALETSDLTPQERGLIERIAGELTKSKMPGPT